MLGRGGESSALPGASSTHLSLLQQVLQGGQILLCWLHTFNSHLNISEHGEIGDQLLVVLQAHLLAELDLQNQMVKQNLKFREKIDNYTYTCIYIF